MIGVISKLENGEHLSPADWKILIAFEFNVSMSTAREYVHILYKCKKTEEFKRMFNPIKKS